MLILPVREHRSKVRHRRH